MKEIMLPYVLFCWLLFKFGIVKRTPRAYTIMISLGCLIAFAIFTAHRYFSPADLTLTTTVRAPYAVLSPALGQEIEEIYVDHNAYVKKGDPIYKLVDDELSANRLEAKEKLKAYKTEYARVQREFE